MSNRRGQQTRDRILESGMDVLLVAGAANVSIRQVASAAGITPMAIYRHFDDKERFELALLDRAFTLFESYLKERSNEGTPLENLVALACRFFDFALERESHFRFLFLSDTRPANRGRGSVVRSISKPTFFLLRDALEECTHERSTEVEDLNQMTIDVLAFCVGQVALVLSGNLSYPQKQKKLELMEAFGRYVKLMRFA